MRGICGKSDNGAVVTKDAESIIALFEELGFERRHKKEGINEDITSVRMRYENEDGKVFHVDIASASSGEQRRRLLVEMGNKAIIRLGIPEMRGFAEA